MNILGFGGMQNRDFPPLSSFIRHLPPSGGRKKRGGMNNGNSQEINNLMIFITMKKLSFFATILIVLISSVSYAQTSAGKCWYIDYEEWNINQPRLHIDCGNDEAFNTGSELTLEMWVRAYTFGENRKVMGKMDEQFNNGYVMGFQNLNIYSEIFNPNLQQIQYQNTGPIPKDSAFVHLVSTYSSKSMKLTDYLNGELVGEFDVFPPDPIAANEAPFLIGSAPWDAYSYQFYGAVDEIRIWNMARTDEEIKEYMYKQLKGDEEGLVAYYNFNQAADTIVPDESMNDNTGELRNSDDPCWTWADSYVPVGDQKMYEMVEPVAAWYGKSPELYNYAATENGLSVITDIGEKEFNKYLVFGHNGSSGISTANKPQYAPDDFERLSREWYLNRGGSFNSDMYLELEKAAGGGETLPVGEPDSLYVLMWRTDTEAPFSAIAYPDQILGSILIFNGKDVQDGYYCIGYASTVIPLSSSDIAEQLLRNIVFVPNPATDRIVIQNGENTIMNIYDLQGNLLKSVQLNNARESILLDKFPSGLYMIEFYLEGRAITKKLIIH